MLLVQGSDGKPGLKRCTHGTITWAEVSLIGSLTSDVHSRAADYCKALLSTTAATALDSI